MQHKQLSYIERRHYKEVDWNEELPPGIDLGDKYPSVPCPRCAASWFEGCNRKGFCPERVEAIEYYDSLPKEERKRIHDEDWKLFCKHRSRKKRNQKKKEETRQLTLF